MRPHLDHPGEVFHHDPAWHIENGDLKMDRCAAEAGHLVIFDRTRDRSWDEKIFRRMETAGGPPAAVWSM